MRTSKYKRAKSMVGQFRQAHTNGEYFKLKTVSNELRLELKLLYKISISKKIIVPVKQVDMEATYSS
jgi:hypothetical protein